MYLIKYEVYSIQKNRTVLLYIKWALLLYYNYFIYCMIFKSVTMSKMIVGDICIIWILNIITAVKYMWWGKKYSNSVLIMVEKKFQVLWNGNTQVKNKNFNMVPLCSISLYLLSALHHCT